MVTDTWNLDIHLWKAERVVLCHFGVKNPRIFASDFLTNGTRINMLPMRCKIKVDFCGENMSNNSSKILMLPGGQKMVEFWLLKEVYMAVISGNFTLPGYNRILRDLGFFFKGSNDILENKANLVDDVQNYGKKYLNFIPKNKIKKS